MKNKNKLSLSIGIPAHNEEGNIGRLIEGIFAQSSKHFILQKIFIILDGCTDNTAGIVKKYAVKYKKIKMINDGKRLGKAMRLNQMYALNKSSLILTIDADIRFSKNTDLDLMVYEFIKDKSAKAVVPRYLPDKPHSLMGWFAYVSYRSFEDAYMQINKGNNHYAVMGCVMLLNKMFSKSFKYPKNTIADHAFMYANANKDGKNHVRIARDANVIFKTVSTFKDWRILGVRSVIMDKQNAVELIGKSVLAKYSMPTSLYFRSLLRWFIKSPLYTAGAVVMNIFIRLFPYKKAMPKGGVWVITNSSKK